jgi:hypothetical protein
LALGAAGGAKSLAKVAEQLRKQKSTYEEARKKADEAIALLQETATPSPSDLAELEGQLKDATKAFNWEKAEKACIQIRETAEKSLKTSLSERRDRLQSRLDRQRASTSALPPEVETGLAKATDALASGDYRLAHQALHAAEGATERTMKARSQGVRERLRSVIVWCGQDSRRDQVEKALAPALEALDHGEVQEGTAKLESLLPEALPEAPAKLRKLREQGKGLQQLSKELDVPTPLLDSAVENAGDAAGFGIELAGDAIVAAIRDVEPALRDKANSKVRELEEFAETLKKEGAEVGDAVTALEEVRGQLANAAPPELQGLVNRAVESVEGPVMSVIAAYIDEVRPRVVEARTLGRNASPALDEVNKARAALKAKEFAPALLAAQKALDLASELVADLEAAHDEIGEFKQLLASLAKGGLSSSAYDEFVRKAEEALRKADVETMRSTLHEGLRVVGRESLPFLRSQLDLQKVLLQRVEEQGWGHPDLPAKLSEVRKFFQEGRFAETAESLSSYLAVLRTQVAPHLSHRLEELGKALEEIPDPELIAGTRRLMAETDIALKVKGDVSLALESLARTEKELAVTFASRASSLVDELEDERKGLAEMGVDTDQLEKEISQTHQIFDMGDFLKASRASRELKSRLLQQQLLRAEQEVSKAKFSLVELAKMGLEPGSLKEGLSDAAERLRSGRYPGAYQRAAQVREEAAKIKETAQQVRQEIAQLAEIVSSLRRSGVPQEEMQPVLPRAKLASEAYQAMDFPRALTLTSELKEALRAVGRKRQATKTLADLDTLLVGARLIGASDPAWEVKVKQAQALQSSGDSPGATKVLDEIAPTVLSTVRTALDKQLKSLDSDIRAANSAGLDTSQVETSVAEARRKLAEPVPLGVAELIDRTRRDFFQGRSFLERAQKSVASAKEAVNQGEMVRADTADLKPRLEEVERALAAGELTHALDLGQKLQKDAEERVRSQVSKTLASFQAMINRAKMEGAVTAVAENLLVQARNLLTAGKAADALKLATKSETELERVELQHSLALNALSTLKAKVEDAQRKGVRIPLVEAEVQQADVLRSRGEYAMVLEKTMDAGDQLLRIVEAHRKCSEALDAAQKGLASLDGILPDAGGSRAELERARQLQSDGKYTEAQGVARSAGETARTAAETLVTDRFEEVRGLLNTLKGLDADAAAPLAPRVALPEEALKARDWKGALSRLSEMKGELNRALEKAFLKQQDELRAAWASSPPPSSEEERGRAELLRSLDEARSKAEFSRYRELMDQGLSSAQKLRRSALEKQVATVESELLLGSRFGVDLGPVMDALGEVKMSMQAGPIDPLLAQLRKAEQLLAQLLGTKLQDHLNEVAGEASYAQITNGIETGPVDALLRSVEELQAKGDIVAAAQRLVEAEGELGRRKQLHWNFTNAEYFAGSLASQKVDVTAVRDLLAEAMRVRDKDFSRALELSQQAVAEIKRLKDRAGAETSPGPADEHVPATGAPPRGSG